MMESNRDKAIKRHLTHNNTEPHLSKCCSLVKGVTGDSQEDVEQSVVSTQGQHHKVESVHQTAFLGTPLGVDCIVHDLVPVLASQYLKQGGDVELILE